jgi:quinoprotein glucose dehydrogenase
MSSRIFFAALLLTFPSLLPGAELPRASGPYNPRVAPASNEGELAIKKFKVAPGLKVELFAAEPNLANPVAFSIDEKGRFYVAETFRLHKGVTDIRGHMNWLDEELASKSTLELARLFEKYEVKGLTDESERVRMIEDRDGDGKADSSSIFAEDFNSSVDGIGAGVLARKGNVWFANIPNLWLLRDNDGDGRADGPKDLRKPLHTGYGVRVGFLGHDLHGLRIGPDGKLYFSIGDRGYNVKTADRTVFGPEMGAVFRCNQDGSELEVFHSGLRNPQELAFDKYGNLFTGDNNSDGGDQARWVYLVEGGDSGWRVGWQFIERPNSRGPWNAEKMWYPQNESQPAYILPPIANIASGPSGLAYFPGLGFADSYQDHFLLVDFRGASGGSGIHSFALKPNGATFDLVDRQQFIWNVLATDVDFGPDGAVYLTDWVEGWGLTGKGRIYRVFDPERRNSSVVAATRKVIAGGFDQLTVPVLTALLAHEDMRVRQEAQFSLADKGAASIKPLSEVARADPSQLARIHGIWGLGQVAKKSPAATDPLLPLLADPDAEVCAQAARVLGEHRVSRAYKDFVKCLSHQDARVRFFAAMGLGKLHRKDAIPPIIEMLRENADKDSYLRHAGVMALTGIGDLPAILTASKDPSPAVRMASLLALRRMGRPEISRFLSDGEPALVLEAARAINDLPIIDALPQLAALAASPVLSEPLARRVVNACFRLGVPPTARDLVAFAVRENEPVAARAEALEDLGDWANPSGRDKVTGLWRPLAPREAKVAREAVSPILPDLLRTAPDPIRIAAAQLAARLEILETAPILYELASNTRLDPAVRVGALKALNAHNWPKSYEAVQSALADANEAMRKEGARLLAKISPGDAVARLRVVLSTGSLGERQNALAAVAGIEGPSADAVLLQWMEGLLGGSMPRELQLDVLEAASKRTNATIRARIQRYESARPRNDPVAPFREALAGGNATEGRKIFLERAEASCLRCHQVGGNGGEVGPRLDGIGGRQPREYILESLIEPNAKIAQGFDTLIVTMKSGATYAGVVKSESPTELVLNSPDDGVLKLDAGNIQARARGLSAMPAGVGGILSKRELRDLVEFLANLK